MKWNFIYDEIEFGVCEEEEEEEEEAEEAEEWESWILRWPWSWRRKGLRKSDGIKNEMKWEENREDFIGAIIIHAFIII